MLSECRRVSLGSHEVGSLTFLITSPSFFLSLLHVALVSFFYLFRGLGRQLHVCKK